MQRAVLLLLIGGLGLGFVLWLAANVIIAIAQGLRSLIKDLEGRTAAKAKQRRLRTQQKAQQAKQHRIAPIAKSIQFRSSDLPV
jgi:hypothetical protein